MPTAGKPVGQKSFSLRGEEFGAALFGFMMGFLLCLIWVEEEKPIKTTPMLSLPPMRLQPYRMTVNQFEELGRKIPEAGAPTGGNPLSYPHEKPA